MELSKKIINVMLSISIALSVFMPLSSQASSVPSSWAVNEVNAAASEGLVTDSVSRDYQAAITREQFCEMVVLAYEKISGNTAKTGSDSFYDTDNNEVLKAANLGIVTGYGDGIFGPKDLITREQIAAMLVRMIDVAVPYANVNVYNNNHFADNSTISDWARPAVNFAYDNKLMQGVGDNKIDPLANTTCEQAVLLVYRAFGNYYNEEAQLDSIYELTEEHIAQDDETYVYYTDNIILAFIKRGLTEAEKEDIADIIDGDVVAQLAGSINLLQIEVPTSSLDELESKAEELMVNDEVYYATPDILINQSLIANNTVYNNGENTYEIDDEWWINAIEADYVWDNYDSFIGTCTVGVIEPNGLLEYHEDLESKVSFSNNEYFTENKQIRGDHGTGVTGIIVANKNNIGVTGIANKSNVIYTPYTSQYENQHEFICTVHIADIIKEQIDENVRAINCSFGMYYWNENYFEEEKNKAKLMEKYKNIDEYLQDQWLITDKTLTKDEFEEYKEDEFENWTIYDNYRKAADKTNETISKIILNSTCPIVKERKDVLFVQGAGNGENNSIYGNGVDAINSSFFAGITQKNSYDILAKYDLSYSEYKNSVVVVGAVENNKSGNDYFMTSWSNWGQNVDICAPGENIKVCNSTGQYEYENSIYNTWYNPSSGTSESAPMVTGTAAVLWGIEPTLTAAEVKDYIINGAKYKAIGVTGSDAGKEYPMLNVRGAVEQLIEKRNVNIMVIDSAGEGALSDVTINYGDNLTAKTDIIGSCDIYLPKGYSEITLSKDGYKSQTVTIEDQYIGQTGDWVDGKIIELEKEEIQNTFNGHIYQFINKKRKWEDAKKYCEEQGGYLVTITSPEENEFVSRLSTNGESFWIGATTDNNFTWATGEQALFTETLEYGEPSAAAKYIVSSSNGYWTNLTDREMCFICEWGDIYEQNQEFEVVDQIQGWWFCYNDEELMEHFSINICFNDDGTYESTSWREKRTGTYTISGNTITVNYDYYYNYAGSTDYNYEWSGVEIFEFDGNTLRRISDTYNGDTNDNIIIFEHKDGYTDPYSV